MLRSAHGVKRKILVVGLAAVTMLHGADAWAKIYQCTVEGRTVFTDQPCGGLGSESENLYVSPSRQPASDAEAPPTARAQPKTPAPVKTPTPAPKTRPTQVQARAAGPPRAEPPAPPKRKSPDLCAAGADPARTPSEAAPPNAGSGKWRLAGEYSDRIPDPRDSGGQRKRRMVRRSSYGIECENRGTRRRVYAIDGRYSLVTPDARGALNLAAPLFESLDSAATAACATADNDCAVQ